MRGGVTLADQDTETGKLHGLLELPHLEVERIAPAREGQDRILTRAAAGSPLPESRLAAPPADQPAGLVEQRLRITILALDTELAMPNGSRIRGRGISA
jgi:hypothetical protein